MKTTLHYQISDFKKFVLDNLESRGYVLAAGCAPEMTNMDDYDDPEQVVMEVLVEDRPGLNQAAVAVLTDQAPVVRKDPPQPRKYKKEGLAGLPPEEQEKLEATRARWRKSAQARKDKKLAVQSKASAQSENKPPEAEFIPAMPITASFQQEVLQSIEELKRGQEVVASAPLPFPGAGSRTG